jgi:hypothetical protein
VAELDHEHLQTRAATTAALQLSMSLLATLRRLNVLDARQAGAVTDAAISALEMQEDDVPNRLARRILESVAQSVAEVGRHS